MNLRNVIQTSGELASSEMNQRAWLIRDALILIPASGIGPILHSYTDTRKNCLIPRTDTT